MKEKKKAVGVVIKAFNLLSLLKRHLALTARETNSQLQQEEGRQALQLWDFNHDNFLKCTFADEGRTLSNTD